MATSALDPQIDLDPFLTQRIGHKYQIFQGAYPQPSNKEHYSDFSCSCVVCVMPIHTGDTELAAADVINHNGRNIGRFQPRRFR